MHTSDSMTLKYVRIYNWLKGMIARNRFKIGEKLPTETEIAEMFNVNRMTVRQAMDMLVQENYITRVKGKGTFLIDNNDKLTYLLDNIISFESIADSYRLKTSYKVIDRQIISASHKLGYDLMIPSESKVLFITRLIAGNNIPLFIERSYFPYDEFSFMFDMDLDQPKVYSTVLEKSGGIALDHSLQSLTADLLSYEEKSLLAISGDKPVPCIRQKNIIYDANSVSVMLFDATFPGDKFQFKVHSGNYSPSLWMTEEPG